MKKLTTFGLVTAGLVALTGCITEVREAHELPPPPVAVAPVAFSPGAAQVLQLAQAGTTEPVMLAYAENAGAPFALNAEQIVALRNGGVPESVITAMMNRDAALRAQYAPPPVPPPVVVTPPPVDTPPPVYVSSPPPDVAYFYDQLSPYGSWVQVEGIGWCWQPRVIASAPNWRPYCDGGHWVYTDAGWYWQSDYSWGWAPFHYGRWQMHERCGWVWVPDRVWAPSWVVWRTENDHCGWAPLPPHADYDAHGGWRYNGVTVAVDFDFGLRPDHFTFVRFGDFVARDLGHRRLERPEVTQIYNHTTIINNYVVNNNTIINQGIRVERIKEATHTEIRKVPLHSTSAPSAMAGRAQTPAREDAVYRTELKAPARPAAAMVAQRIDVRHPVIAHNESAAKAMPTREIRTPDTVQNSSAPPAKSETHPAVVRDRPVNRVPEPQQNYKEPSAPAAPQPVVGRNTGQPNRPTMHPVNTPAPATHNKPMEQPKPVTRTTTAFLPAPKPAATASPAQNQPPAPGGNSRRQEYPLRISAEKPVGAQISPEGGQNSHVYEPKSARQAAEAHALPAANPRPVPKAPAPNTLKVQPKRAE